LSVLQELSLIPEEHDPVSIVLDSRQLALLDRTCVFIFTTMLVGIQVGVQHVATTKDIKKYLMYEGL